MTRPDWQNLNGEWQLRQSATDDTPQFGPRTLPERVNVPFPVESALSGRDARRGNDNRNYLFYRRTFTVPAGWSGRRVQLNFGAVDWQTTVLGQRRRRSGGHTGGYDALQRSTSPTALNGGTNELVVRVYDPSDARQNGSRQPIGKQHQDAEAASSTRRAPASGRRCGWSRPPAASISSALDLHPNLADQHRPGPGVHPRRRVTGHAVLAEALQRRHRGRHRHRRLHRVHGPGAQRRRWSPDDPFLYNLRVTLRNAGGRPSTGPCTTSGCARSASGLVNGVRRPLLNGAVRVPDRHARPGLLAGRPLHRARPTRRSRFDLQKHKDLGFNMVRKHIKVEPQRWFYHADRLGAAGLAGHAVADRAEHRRQRGAAGPVRDRGRARSSTSTGRRPAVDRLHAPSTRVGASGSLADTPAGRPEHQEPGPDPAGERPQWLQLLPVAGQPRQRRHRRLARVLGPDAPTAADRGSRCSASSAASACTAPGHEWSPSGGFFAYEWRANATALTDRYVGLGRRRAEPDARPQRSAAIYTRSPTWRRAERLRHL